MKACTWITLILALFLSFACSSDDDESESPQTDGDDSSLLPDGDEEDDDTQEDGDLLDGDEDGDEESDEPVVFHLVKTFPPTTAAGVAFSYTFQAAGGETPYSGWTLVEGTLPDGTSLDAQSGVWSGTPQTEGFYYFVIQAGDAAGAEAREVFGIRIGDPQAQGRMARLADDYQRIYEERHIWHGWSLDLGAPDATNGDYQLETYGDSSFMGGQCTMAQAYRAAVLDTDEAKATIRDLVQGWKFFQDLTGVSGLTGRGFAHKDDPSEDGMWDSLYPEVDKHQGTGEFADWFWQADASRDQYTGAVIGNAMANELVDDEEVKQTSKEFLVALADHIWDNGLAIVDPDGEMTTHGELDGMNWEGLPAGNGLNAICGLAWFKIAYHVSGEQRFKDYYEELAFERDYITILRENMWVYMKYGTKYYNVYMAFENWFHLMRLEDDPDLRQRYKEIFRDTLWLNVDDTETNRRAVDEKNPVYTTWYLYSTGEKDPTALMGALWQMDGFPEAPLRDTARDHTNNPEITVNPDFPEESLYPIHISERCPDMVMWHRTPYKLQCTGDGRERTGCDYMLPYWMGRYYGWIGEEW